MYVGTIPVCQEPTCIHAFFNKHDISMNNLNAKKWLRH